MNIERLGMKHPSVKLRGYASNVARFSCCKEAAIRPKERAVIAQGDVILMRLNKDHINKKP
jgi:hypothetical protein